MAFGRIDPAQLSGAALRTWYLRSPMEIEREREAAENLRYDDFVESIRLAHRPGDHNSDPRGVQLAATIDGICVACHRGSQKLPPIRRVEPPGGGGQPPHAGAGRASKGPPPQCAEQYNRDSSICRRQPNAASREMCWRTAAEREAYCIKSKGEIGWPSLFTHD